MSQGHDGSSQLAGGDGVEVSGPAQASRCLLVRPSGRTKRLLRIVPVMCFAARAEGLESDTAIQLA